MSDETPPMFSRAHLPAGFGKCDPEPVRFLLPEEAKEQLAGLAVLHGKSVSEYVRDLVLKELYGSLRMMREKNLP
ncbi:MAG: hypothetical protein IBX49_11535 [Gammaproteobacteria bacterium]|nr:hypothetical protein [Gammaproteobacteria bacterium]